MRGTIFSVTEAILLIPPIIITPTKAANIRPMTAPEKVVSSPNKSFKTIVVLGDGECNEGSVWEAALFASSKNLNNLYAIIDNNGWQGIGRNKDILDLSPLKKKWESFGWKTYVINGHNENELKKIFKLKKRVPTAIIAKTIKGKGVSFMEDDNNWHYRIPTKEEILIAQKELKIK